MSGKTPKQTFMQKPETVLTKFKDFKEQFTKVWEWFDK